MLAYHGGVICCFRVDRETPFQGVHCLDVVGVVCRRVVGLYRLGNFLWGALFAKCRFWRFSCLIWFLRTDCDIAVDMSSLDESHSLLTRLSRAGYTFESSKVRPRLSRKTRSVDRGFRWRSGSAMPSCS